jgi:site-specific recombinase XerD
MQFIEQFLEMMLAERGIAKNSLLSYKRDLEDFQEFLKQARLTEIEAKDSDISKFIALLAKSGISARSINRKISTVKSYFIFQIDCCFNLIFYIYSTSKTIRVSLEILSLKHNCFFSFKVNSIDMLKT